MLASSGALDRTLFGPPVGVKEDDSGQVVVAGDVHRRSLYLLQRRTQPVALMQAFDAPVMQTNCEARPSSTVATQSLMLMNGEFWLGQARWRWRIAPAGAGEGPADGARRRPAATLGTGAPALAIWLWQAAMCSPAARRRLRRSAHWTGSSWQGGKDLPDEQTGWVLLHADGGHPGNNPDFAAIRRWTAPADWRADRATARSVMAARERRRRSRRASWSAPWASSANGRCTMARPQPHVEQIAVSAGDTVDFITDCREHVTSDSFTWHVELSLKQGDGVATTFRSHEGFHGPLGQQATVEMESILASVAIGLLAAADARRAAGGLRVPFAAAQLPALHPQHIAAGRSPETQALVNLCQALLSSNEFLYVD